MPQDPSFADDEFAERAFRVRREVAKALTAATKSISECQMAMAEADAVLARSNSALIC